jgi:hypothetical protein
MAECVIYTDENFTGESLQVFDNIPNLTNHRHGFGGAGNWNDEISSIVVHSGTFRFFEHVDFGGAYKDLGPGRYPSSVYIGLTDNTISSIEKRSD